MKQTLLALGLVAAVAALTLISATSKAQTAPGLKSDSAELCMAVNKTARIIRPFSDTKSYFVQAPSDPRVKPEVKENYTYSKDSAGYTLKNQVDFDMFDLMAEPFGGSPQPRSLWTGTFEVIYQGKVTVSDETGKTVGTFEMDCNAALLEYN